MPPKKTSLPSQKSLLPTSAAAPLGSARTPLPAPLLPASDSVPPLWCPSSRPRELFAEWPAAATLAAENWGSPDTLFEDPLLLSEMFLPHEIHRATVTWKRPSQFMPPIVEPTHFAPATPLAVAAAHDAKAPPAKKGTATSAVKKPAAAAAESESMKKALPPLKHAHVFYMDRHYDAVPDHVDDHKRAVTPATGSANALGAVHASTNAHAPHSSSAATLSTTSLSTATTECAHRIPRDFRRLWSADELGELAKWRIDDMRVTAAQQQRERVYMAFEDAIAYIVNDRPRGAMLEDDVDADDLVDDGQDDDDDDIVISNSDAANGHDSSPWGVLPPPRIDVVPHAVSKPECPHGDVVHGAMASLFRIVEQLYDNWTSNSTYKPPFLWRAIYPQDAAGVPVYNPSGKYAVKLFVAGKWRRVDIDDRLPIDADNNIVYVTSALRSEIWPALLAKALFKVLHWLFGPVDVDDASETSAMRIVNTVISALTGWKMSRWAPTRPSTATSDATLQELLAFVSVAHTEPTSEQLNDTAGDDSSEATTTLSDTQSLVLRPRAVICSTLTRDTAVLSAGEAALVTDIVGDVESAMIKFTGLRGAASVPEERLDVDSLVFLLLHPPSQHTDLLVQQWTAAATTSDAAGSHDTDTVRPFANPVTVFASIALPLERSLRVDDDATDSDAFAPSPIDVVLTLTRIAPVDAAAYDQDAQLQAASAMAQYVPAMDPLGSAVLIEERSPSQSACLSSSLPLVVTLNLTTSTRVVLPLQRCRGRNVLAFRVEPQASLCYGYSLEIESSYVHAAFQDASTYWRDTCDVQVVTTDGVYPVLQAHTWHALVKHNIELVPPPAVAAGGQNTLTLDATAELFVDLYISDALLVPFVHVTIVDDATGETTALPALCAAVSLPITTTTQSRAFTLVVDCGPHAVDVRAGTWRLTLGSNWHFRASTAHAMKLSAFEAPYVANRSLLLFRDIIVAPTQPLWTTCELQLLSASSNAGTNSDADDPLADALAVKLAVIDVRTDEVLSEVCGMRSVRLPQLPQRRLSSDSSGTAVEVDNASKSSGVYILQGTIDRTRCVVSDALCSVQPFRNRIGLERTETTAVVTELSSISGGNGDGDSDTATSCPSTARLPTGVKWRLNCWSADDVKLDVDRTQELRFAAIRAAWADAAKDRNAVTNGAVSRLLFLGKLDAVDNQIRDDGVADELTARIKARFEWLAAAASSNIIAGDGPYLTNRRGRADASDVSERMRSPEDFATDDRALSDAIAAAYNCVAQQREDRAASKARRVQEVHDLVQSIREQRSAALKKRTKLWQDRDALLQPSPSTA